MKKALSIFMSAIMLFSLAAFGQSGASKDDIPDTYYQMWMTVGRVFAEDLLNYDIYEAISAYKKDVLLIHGDADSIVPISYSEKAVEVYDSAQLKVLSGAGHGFYGNDAEQAITWTLEYLETHKK